MNTSEKTPKRTLKVYSRFIIPSFGKAVLLPEIRLTGNWLRKWGFECGTTINVIKTEGGIIIRSSTQSPPVIHL